MRSFTLRIFFCFKLNPINYYNFLVTLVTIFNYKNDLMTIKFQVFEIQHKLFNTKDLLFSILDL